MKRKNLLIWLSPSMFRQNDLMYRLLLKEKQKVIWYLKKNRKITLTRIEKEVNKISVTEFYSRRKAVVTDTKTFGKTLVSEMEDKGVIAEEMDCGKKIYKLKEKV